MNVSSERLRRTLWANAIFSIVSAAGLALFAEPFASAATAARPSVLGLDLAILFELLGVGVIAFGALCAWVARRDPLPRAWAQANFAADIAWLLASVVVLAPPASWTNAGIAGIVVLAVIVADLAIVEYLGLRRIRPDFRPHPHTAT